MSERKEIIISSTIRHLGSYILLTSLFVGVILGSPYVIKFADAQINNTERCDADVCHIEITKDGFVPKTLTAKIGSTVIWTNIDYRSHTVTSGSPGTIILPFNSKLLNKNDTYEFTFEYSGFYKGKYQYFDQVTGIMNGEIIVEPETEMTEATTKVQTISVDFTDPKSGIKNISFSGGTIKSMEKDSDSRSLILNVETVEMPSILEITIDRNLIDAKINGTDGPFVVFAKKATSLVENEAYYEEISNTPTDRALRIFVPEQTTEIKIVGAEVVPEFPLVLPVIALVLATIVVALRIFNKCRITNVFHVNM